MTDQAIGPVARAADNPRPKPRTDNGEDAFAKFLRKQGWTFAWEAYTFDGLTPSYEDGPERAYTPDVKLISYRGKRLAKPIYLELTEADRYIVAADLPEDIQRKNELFSSSGKPFISFEEYMLRKTEKIILAMIKYQVAIYVLTHAQQLELMRHPELLVELVLQAAQTESGHLRLVV